MSIITLSLKYYLFLYLSFPNLQRQQGLLLLRNYITAFSETVLPTADVYLDSDENASVYSAYNTFRRDLVKSGKEIMMAAQQKMASSLFKLETEQLVFYKIVRELIRGRWVVVVGNETIE